MPEYRFHEFVLQTQQRRLLGPDGAEVELTPRLFDALLFLVERAGELLDKDRLLTELWPGVVVEENSLSQSISALRKALGDDPQRSRFIQTVPRRGFRFVAPVVVPAVAPVSAPVSAPVLVPVVASTLAPVAVLTAAAAAPVRDAGEWVAVAAPAEPSLSRAAMPSPALLLSPRRAWVIGAVAGAVLLTGAGAAAWRWRQARGAAPAGAASTLAILPFKPVAVAARDELLEIGMAESLVARLSNLPGVAVRSVGSVRRFGGAEQDPIAAARELNVTWIVDGSVQRSGARVRVTARLLNTASGEAAWSGRFDEEFTGVFDLQDSISIKVAQVLAPHLGRRGQHRLSGAGGTRHVDAYQLYLTARRHAQGIKTAGLVKSIELFRQAIALDPLYALAHSGMGESYRRMVFGADGEPKVVLTEAMRWNQRAVQLDPELAEGHAGVGYCHFWHGWDWTAAAAAFDHALALNASDAHAHFGYSQLLETLSRGAQALEHLRQSRESDPLSLILLTLESGSLLAAGRPEEARQRLQRVFDIEPEFWVAHMVQSFVLMAEGKTEAAFDSLTRADQLADGSSQATAALGHALARKGQTERARAVLQRLLEAERSRYVPPTSSGLIYAGLGDKPATLAALERAVAVRDVRMTLVKQDRRWSLVADDPRYTALMRQMNLG